MSPRARERSVRAASAALAAVVAFLPFLRGTLASACLYFRDLSLHFLPLRRFALERLRAGEVAFWNPYVHEGVPLSLPAIGYPLDLAGLLRPDPWFLSLLVALHVPLGAVAFWLLARGLGLRLEAACGGAFVYALGGFYLSTVNLYVYVQAAAWAPCVVLSLVRLLRGPGWRAVAVAALALAVSLSTTGVEIVVQAVAVGVVLGITASRPIAAASRLAAALGLAAVIAAPVLVLLASQVEGSARGRGFTTDVVLAHSVHPFALLQTVVGSLFGNPANLANEWWGQNFFPRGFPYVLSLYLGACALSLALAGLATRRPLALRLGAVLAIGLWLALGSFGGLAPLVDSLPALHAFRFPVKAFFCVHLAASLLAALGLQALAESRRRAPWIAAGALGTLLAAAPLLPLVFPGPLARFAQAFFPPGTTPEARAALLGRVLGDAAAGGALALALAAVGFAAWRGGIAAPRAAWLAAGIVAADLLRSGSGLNPMVSRSFYEPSAELRERLPPLRLGRVYTCPLETSPAYHAGRAARGPDHELWSFALMSETLSPAFNVPRQVPTALSPDLTMLVPTERILAPEQGDCRELDSLVPRLRAAAVSTVLSLDPLDSPELEPLFVLAPARAVPAAIHAYALRETLPRVALAGPGTARLVSEQANRIELATRSDAAAALVVRDAWARGWRAQVDGVAAPLPEGRHRRVELAAGEHRVVLSYRPPGLSAAMLAAALGLLGVAFLWAAPARWRGVPSAAHHDPRHGGAEPGAR